VRTINAETDIGAQVPVPAARRWILPAPASCSGGGHNFRGHHSGKLAALHRADQLHCDEEAISPEENGAMRRIRCSALFPLSFDEKEEHGFAKGH